MSFLKSFIVTKKISQLAGVLCLVFSETNCRTEYNPQATYLLIRLCTGRFRKTSTSVISLLAPNYCSSPPSLWDKSHLRDPSSSSLLFSLSFFGRGNRRHRSVPLKGWGDAEREDTVEERFRKGKRVDVSDWKIETTKNWGRRWGWGFVRVPSAPSSGAHPQTEKGDEERST